LETATPKSVVQAEFVNPLEIRYAKSTSYCFLKYEDEERARDVKEKCQEKFMEAAYRESGPVKFIGFMRN